MKLFKNTGSNPFSIIIILIFCISLYFFDYYIFYSKYTNFDRFTDFGDLFLLLKGIDLYRAGIDPFLQNYNPPYNYPSSWSVFKYLPFINKENTYILGIFLISLSLLLFNELIKKQYNFLLIYLSALLSPVSILLFERGNCDILILILALLAGLFFYKKIIPLLVVIFVAFALKLYPIVWFTVLIFFISKKNTMIYGILAFAAFTAFIFYNHQELILINKNTPFDLNNFTYGFRVILLRFRHLSPLKKIIEIFILGLMIPFSFFLYLKRYTITNLEYNKYVFLFTVGVSTIFLTSLLTINWDYRLFFLILCFPLLISMKRYLLIALILLLFWYQTIRMYFFSIDFLVELKQILLLGIVLNLLYIMINIIFLELKKSKLSNYVQKKFDILKTRIANFL